MSMMINGVPVSLPNDPRVSLLDLLREHLGLPGTKKGCNQGACGACTVLVDGERILSCLALAVQYDGRAITTIEGLGRPGALHPLQQAFVEHDGFQCGYCTPGQICSAVGMASEIAARRAEPCHRDLAAETIALSRDELRERMSGNLCRCGAHNGIVAAIAETLAEARRMTPFTYTRATDAADAVRRAAVAGRQVSRRRHQPGRPDARDDRAARGAGRRDGPVARHRRAAPDGGLLIGAAARNTARRRASRWCGRAIRCSPARSWRAHRRRSATWRRSAATCSSARAAPISTTTTDRAATSASRARAATRSRGSTASTPSSAPRPPASPTHPSDMCVALAALDAVVHLEGRGGDAQRWR